MFYTYLDFANAYLSLNRNVTVALRVTECLLLTGTEFGWFILDITVGCTFLNHTCADIVIIMVHHANCYIVIHMRTDWRTPSCGLQAP